MSKPKKQNLRQKLCIKRTEGLNYLSPTSRYNRQLDDAEDTIIKEEQQAERKKRNNDER